MSAQEDRAEAPEVTADPPAEGPPVDLAQPDEPAKPVPRRGGRLGMALAALAVVAGGGFAAAWFDVLKLRGADPVPALEQRLTALEGTATADAAALAALTDRLASAEMALAAATEGQTDVAALEQRLAALEAALQQIAESPVAADGGVSGPAVAALAAQVQAMKDDLAALQATTGAGQEAIAMAVDAAMADWSAAQEAKAQAAVDAARQQAQLIEAYDRLRAAAQSGTPYAEALPALAGVTLAPALRDGAETGLPTPATLADTFPEAARRALEASLRASGGEGLGDRLLTFLRVQTGARSLEPRDGADPDAILSRAEAAVAVGDVAAALAELAALPEAGRAELSDWTARAETYLAAQAALAALAAELELQGDRP
jgi:hypothetical protein